MYIGNVYSTHLNSNHYRHRVCLLLNLDSIGYTWTPQKAFATHSFQISIWNWKPHRFGCVHVLAYACVKSEYLIKKLRSMNRMACLWLHFERNGMESHWNIGFDLILRQLLQIGVRCDDPTHSLHCTPPLNPCKHFTLNQNFMKYARHKH